MAVVLNKEQIMEIIPHRDPFLLIDEVSELEVGKRVKATKYIKAEDFWFKGHFPNYPNHNHPSTSPNALIFLVPSSPITSFLFSGTVLPIIKPANKKSRLN